jgi:hypothetical protein
MDSLNGQAYIRHAWSDDQIFAALFAALFPTAGSDGKQSIRAFKIQYVPLKSKNDKI